MKRYFQFLLIVFIAAACSKPAKTSGQIDAQIKMTYQESNEDFPNPERGFYRYSQTTAGDFTPLSLNQLKEWRGLTQADNGNYSVYSTLVFRYYILDIFKDKTLSIPFLNSIQTDFDIARLAGMKLIPRFTYTNDAKKGNCPEGFICPPYGDAPKEVVLQHIAQLKDVFHKNADVIACVQMGFIGVWGEQYYTDFFGDPSQNGTQKKLLDQNWDDRIEVVKALLDAVPKDRMIQVRYPQLKQRTIYGKTAPVNSAPLTSAEAFTKIDKARIGYHNDCFLASTDDYGTYEDYGNSSSPRQTALASLKPYKQSDSKYVVVGGETCDDTYSPQNDCEPAGIAQREMAAMHYSFLNCAYNNDVNNDWQTGGCMQEIKKNLGYRFVLKSATFPKAISKEKLLSFKLELENKGYAACYNERNLVLVMRNSITGQQYFITTDADPRKWYTGAVVLESSVALPQDIPVGKYDLFLSLPDKYASISLRTEYAIRLANNNIWESATGFNKLSINIEVK